MASVKLPSGVERDTLTRVLADVPEGADTVDVMWGAAKALIHLRDVMAAYHLEVR